MFKNQKVLIIEDDVEINKLLHVILEKAGLIPVSAYSGTEGILLLEKDTFDLILLDLMLPGMTGETFIQTVKATNTVPIVVISAKVDVEDRVHVLKSGADDYITKPFNQEEVLARIEVQLRKRVHQNIKNTKLHWKGLEVDKASRIVLLNHQPLKLTNAEFDILSFLIEHPETALSKQKIYESIWTGPYLGDDNTVSVHISNLRKKIAVHTDIEYIQTIWGIGFMLI